VFSREHRLRRCKQPHPLRWDQPIRIESA